MSILITGGAGYLGSHLCLSLVEEKESFIVVDNLCNSTEEGLQRIEIEYDTFIPFYQVDLRDETALGEVFKAHKIKYVIHLAGLKSVKESVKNPLMYYENNINSTLTLLKVMEKYNCFKMIFSSSATVYGIPKKVPVTEDSPTCAISPYGSTKLIIEKILEDTARADFRWKFIALRYFNPISTHRSGILEEKPKGVPENLVPYITKVLDGELPELTVFGKNYDTKDGTCVRDYIYVLDLVRGHLAAMKHLDKMEDKGYDVFNLGTGKGYTVLELLDCFKAYGSPVPYKIGDRRLGDVPSIFADVSKAKKILGWEARSVVGEMVYNLLIAQNKRKNRLEKSIKDGQHSSVSG